ncbi:MAG: FeoA family protein [Colwellia sp.]
MTLLDLPKGKVFKISSLPANEGLCEQLVQQGFALQTKVSLAHKAPFNGPVAFRLHNTKICLQRSVAEQIFADHL